MTWCIVNADADTAWSNARMTTQEIAKKVQPSDTVEWFLRVSYGQTYKQIGLAFEANQQTVSHHVMKLMRCLEHPIYNQLVIEAGLKSAEFDGSLQANKRSPKWLRMNIDFYIPRLVVYARQRGLEVKISDVCPPSLNYPIWPDIDSLREPIAKELSIQQLERDMGTQMLTALHDPRTVALMLNPDGKLWQERLGEPMRCIGAVSANRAEAIIKTIAGYLGKEVTRSKPILEGELPLDGSRFAGQLPPVVAAPSFAIQKRLQPSI